MDGNGRWAKKRGLPRVFGHKKGVETVKEIVLHANSRNLQFLSLYAFSIENWLRPKDEVSFLMRLLEEYMEREVKTFLENGIRLVVSGRTDMLPKSTMAKIKDCLVRSETNTGLTLNLCISYGGRAELVDACKKIIKEVQEDGLDPSRIDNETFSRHLYNPSIPDVDLLIRTSGEQRISNFMLWRAAYAEFLFVDKYWPDFTSDDFDASVEEYANRTRRFGKTDEQIENDKNGDF